MSRSWRRTVPSFGLVSGARPQSTRHDWVNALTLDSGGEVYVTGFTSGPLAGYPMPAEVYAAYVSRVGADGSMLWTHVYNQGNTVDTRGDDITIAQNGDILLAGTVLGELQLDVESLGADVFLMRLCPDGTSKTVQQWGLGGDDWTRGIAQDAGGSILLTGYARRDPDPGGGTRYNDTFLIAVSPE